MAEMQFSPTQIEAHSPTEMLIAWNSGERFVVPYAEIRFQCPCAGCVDEHTGQRTIRREQVRTDIKPTGVQVVGRYAIQISWNDGHGSGLYHFEKLHEICRKTGQAPKP